MASPSTPKQATSHHPQIVILLIDNSGSMQEEGKCQQTTEAVGDLVMTVQALNQQASGSRFIVNLCSFGDDVKEMALAALPNEIDLQQLNFTGDQEGTNLQLALKWAKDALEKSLDRSRHIPGYQEDKAPDPLCVVLSDGEFEVEPCRPHIQALHQVSIKNGKVDVVAVGVAMQDEHFQAMKEIASRPDFAIPIGSQEIAEFLSEVTQTVVYSTPVNDLAARRR